MMRQNDIHNNNNMIPIIDDSNAHLNNYQVLNGIAGMHNNMGAFNNNNNDNRNDYLNNVEEEQDQIIETMDRDQFELDSWLVKFQELKEFHAQHGHTIVPHTYASRNRSSLASWVKQQRNQRKRKLRGDHSTLTDERELALDSLGFVWDAHGVSWEERFNDLIDFKERYGHCNVPSSYTDNRKLAVWVKSQRRHYRLWRKGDQRSFMTRDRFDQLNKIGFCWTNKHHH